MLGGADVRDCEPLSEFLAMFRAFIYKVLEDYGATLKSLRFVFRWERMGVMTNF